MAGRRFWDGRRECSIRAVEETAAEDAASVAATEGKVMPRRGLVLSETNAGDDMRSQGCSRLLFPCLRRADVSR